MGWGWVVGGDWQRQESPNKNLVTGNCQHGKYLKGNIGEYELTAVKQFTHGSSKYTLLLWIYSCFKYCI